MVLTEELNAGKVAAAAGVAPPAEARSEAEGSPAVAVSASTPPTSARRACRPIACTNVHLRCM